MLVQQYFCALYNSNNERYYRFKIAVGTREEKWPQPENGLELW